MPKKFVACNAAWVAWLAANSPRVGIAANAAVYAAAAASCRAAAPALSALACVSHAR
ncbi:hypothetical protein PICSAR15_01666 [Mycobacterium avium subsp. paratuberculosis]|nr:hypothetical protein PICSAR15_01666 [Mycobacterium avium subsp. paratuberculosis]CAG7066712.1 hypothetical protein PICSAR181_02427 [Mycobacterium avium subsp. paratuberculosis]CAG7309600.1 hypothetical protein PICSAR65_00727 [Mycobacterium avium subsp. paratuberculosis]CAG7339525.1 hypothetical protein PICSAR7_00854 [Mycobacterium avium subsp. paratuberculosis]